jgi:hypothetical protein
VAKEYLQKPSLSRSFPFVLESKFTSSELTCPNCFFPQLVGRSDEYADFNRAASFPTRSKEYVKLTQLQLEIN